MNMMLPNVFKSCRMIGWFSNHTQAMIHLHTIGRGVFVDGQGELGEVPDEKIKYLIEYCFIRLLDEMFFDDQLPVNDQGKEFTQCKQEIHILYLLLIWWRCRQHLSENVYLLLEECDVGYVDGIIDRAVIMEADMPQPPRRSLLE